MKLVPRTLIALLALAALSLSQTTQPLFFIERSTNKNKVYYEARITREGAFDKQNPVHGYWILWAKDSSGQTREELNLVEKNMAYGLKIQRRADKTAFTMTLAAFPQRGITVFIDSGKAVAQAVINGGLSRLEKIYISSRETKMLPKVNYVELFGVDPKTGERRYEKIVPK
jgi:hypothetical protein